MHQVVAEHSNRRGAGSDALRPMLSRTMQDVQARLIFRVQVGGWQGPSGCGMGCAGTTRIQGPGGWLAGPLRVRDGVQARLIVGAGTTHCGYRARWLWQDRVQPGQVARMTKGQVARMTEDQVARMTEGQVEHTIKRPGGTHD